MTTYTVTITHTDDYGIPTGEIDTLTYDNLAAAKTAAKRNSGAVITRKNAKTVAEQPKFWYYRGTQVSIIEERQMGYTLVNANDGSFFFRYANTSELEYR